VRDKREIFNERKAQDEKKNAQLDEVTTMKFYKLYLTQQRNSFYASNVPFSSLYSRASFFSSIRKHIKMPTRTGKKNGGS
jgi:hypothetical protein